MARRSHEHPYRGDDAPDRTERLRAEVTELAARITDAYWLHLGDELRSHALDSIAEEDPAALESVRDACRDAIAQAPRMTTWLSARPSSAGEPLIGEPWPSQETVVMPAGEWARAASREHAATLASRIARWVDGYDANATLLMHWKGALRSMFRALDAPFVLEAEETWWNDDVAVVLATAVARGVPKLDVQPKAWMHTLAAAVRLSDGVPTGDERFDRLFAVEGETRQLLGAEVRGALSAMARSALPSLTVGDGRAVVRFRYVLSTDLLDYALQLLSAVRHAPLRVELVRAPR